MYRNLIHTCGPETNWESNIFLSTWDEDGNPIECNVTYYPHLYYVPWKDTDQVDENFTTITGKPLVKKEFKNIFEHHLQ